MENTILQNNEEEIFFENNIITMPKLKIDIERWGMGYAFYYAMQQNSDKIAQINASTGRKDTYGNLLQKSICTAIEMQKSGIKANDVVCLITDINMDFIVPFIATFLIGAKLACINYNFLIKDKLYLVNTIKPSIIFAIKTEEENLHYVQSKANCKFKIVIFGSSNLYLSFDDFLQASREQIENFRPVKVDCKKQTAVIAITSGTSSTAKCVELSHYSIMSKAFYFRALGFDTNIWLHYTPISWISGSILLTELLLNGTSRVIASTFSALQCLDLIDTYKITVLFLTTDYIVELLKFKETISNTNISSLRDFCYGGSVLSKKYAEDLKSYFPMARVQSSYGVSECGGVLLCRKPFYKKDMTLFKSKEDSCGTIIPGYQYQIVNIETKEPLGKNSPGLLQVKSDFVFKNYTNVEENPLDENGWYNTGDVMYYDEDFYFYFVDRQKDIFPNNYWYIIPSKLEALLTRLSYVKEAVVIPIPHDRERNRAMAIVTLMNESDNCVTVEDIDKYVTERVDKRYRLTGGVRIVKELPYNSTGKLDRLRIKEMVMNDMKK